MKISVITASYNYANYIGDTIQSVIDQTYTDFELIVVDDCSTDNSVEVIKSFNDERIKLIINDQNLGLKESLKRGLKEATGEWIAFLESDDILVPDNLEKKFEIIQRYPETALVFNDVETFGEEHKRIYLLNKSAKYLQKKEYPRNMFYDLGEMNRILTFSTVLVKKDRLAESDFDTPIDRFLDWWLFIHLARNNKFYYIPEKLTKWRIHRESYINKKKKKYTLPISIYAIIDIIIKEKNIFLIPFLLITTLKLFILKYQRIIQSDKRLF